MEIHESRVSQLKTQGVTRLARSSGTLLAEPWAGEGIVRENKSGPWASAGPLKESSVGLGYLPLRLGMAWCISEGSSTGSCRVTSRLSRTSCTVTVFLEREERILAEISRGFVTRL